MLLWVKPLLFLRVERVLTFKLFVSRTQFWVSGLFLHACTRLRSLYRTRIPLPAPLIAGLSMAVSF